MRGVNSREAVAFHVLGNDRRLFAIHHLGSHPVGARVAVRDLARVVRAIELGEELRAVDTADYESAYASMTQVHLPTMAKAGAIAYDDDRKVVTVTERTHAFAMLAALGRFSAPPTPPGLTNE